MKKFTSEDILRTGQDAEALLAKYPYAAVREKNHHKVVAVIGKLAEEGFLTVSKEIDEETLQRMEMEVEKEAADLRRNGMY